MIVKDEEKVIERCLESVYRHIDRWCIVDTGSIDRTPELITNFFTAKGIEGQLHHSEWVDFEHNREESLQYGKQVIGPNDYCLTMDADEEFKVEKTFKIPKPLCKTYAMIEYRGCKLSRSRIFRAIDYQWWYPIHESLQFISTERQEVIDHLPHCYIDSHFDGARGRDPKRWLRDAEVADGAIEVRERGELWRGRALNLCRLYFYSGNSHYSAEQYEMAIDRYRKRVQIPGFAEEIFRSYLMIAKCKRALGKSREEVVGAFLEAYFHRPTRYEPIYEVLHYLVHRGDIEQAKLFADRMLSAVVPNDILMVEEDAYVEGKKLAKMLIKPSPSDSVNLATTHYLNKRWDQVVNTLNVVKVKDLGPVDKFTYYDLYFIAYSWLGKLTQARDALEKIFAMSLKYWKKHVPRLTGYYCTKLQGSLAKLSPEILDAWKELDPEKYELCSKETSSHQ